MIKLCKCKSPNIQIKNSENGISWYCKICAKQYEVPKEEVDELIKRFDDYKEFSNWNINGI